MKHQTMIKLITVTGLLLGPLNASASGFGGGWVHDPDTGTLSYTGAASPGEGTTATDSMPSHRHMNSFGGGWVHDPDTGTLSYTGAASPGEGTAATDSMRPHRHMNSFGGGWIHDEATGTLSFNP